MSPDPRHPGPDRETGKPSDADPVRPDEEAIPRYGMRKSDAGEPENIVHAQPAETETGQPGRSSDRQSNSQLPPQAPDMPLNPDGQQNPKPQGPEKSDRDNPYGGDRRYESDFAHAGYGGPGVASDKG